MFSVPTLHQTFRRSPPPNTHTHTITLQLTHWRAVELQAVVVLHPILHGERGASSTEESAVQQDRGRHAAAAYGNTPLSSSTGEATSSAAVQ